MILYNLEEVIHVHVQSKEGRSALQILETACSIKILETACSVKILKGRSAPLINGYLNFFKTKSYTSNLLKNLDFYSSMYKFLYNIALLLYKNT